MVKARLCPSFFGGGGQVYNSPTLAGLHVCQRQFYVNASTGRPRNGQKFARLHHRGLILNHTLLPIPNKLYYSPSLLRREKDRRLGWTVCTKLQGFFVVPWAAPLVSPSSWRGGGWAPIECTLHDLGTCRLWNRSGFPGSAQTLQGHFFLLLLEAAVPPGAALLLPRSSKHVWAGISVVCNVINVKQVVRKAWIPWSKKTISSTTLIPLGIRPARLLQYQGHHHGSAWSTRISLRGQSKKNVPLACLSWTTTSPPGIFALAVSMAPRANKKVAENPVRPLPASKLSPALDIDILL